MHKKYLFLNKIIVFNYSKELKFKKRIKVFVKPKFKKLIV
jgi:hypothetical protein